MGQAALALRVAAEALAALVEEQVFTEMVERMAAAVDITARAERFALFGPETPEASHQLAQAIFN